MPDEASSPIGRGKRSRESTNSIKSQRLFVALFYGIGSYYALKTFSELPNESIIKASIAAAVVAAIFRKATYTLALFLLVCGLAVAAIVFFR